MTASGVSRRRDLRWEWELAGAIYFVADSGVALDTPIRPVSAWRCGSVWLDTLQAWTGVRAKWLGLLPVCTRWRWHRGDHRRLAARPMPR